MYDQLKVLNETHGKLSFASSLNQLIPISAISHFFNITLYPCLVDQCPHPLKTSIYTTLAEVSMTKNFFSS